MLKRYIHFDTQDDFVEWFNRNVDKIREPRYTFADNMLVEATFLMLTDEVLYRSELRRVKVTLKGVSKDTVSRLEPATLISPTLYNR